MQKILVKNRTFVRGGRQMNPNYVHTITLYNCIRAKDIRANKDVWRKTVLRDCFYKASETVVQDGTSASKVSTYTARIPAHDRFLRYPLYCKTPDGYFTVSVGDIVVLGECAEDITDEMPAAKLLIKHKPDAFIVSTFSDNTGHITGRHYKIGG